MRWDTLFSVFDFQEVLNSKFYIDDILNYFYIKKTVANVKKVQAYLVKKNIAFVFDRDRFLGTPYYDFGDAHWVLKNEFFQNKSFVVKPSRFEIENNILIVGSRFNWSFNSEFAYNNICLFYKATPLTASFFSMPFSQAQYYFFLESEIEYLNDVLNQHPDNFENFSVLSTNAQVNVKCFLMDDVYRNLDFQEGDRLVIKIMGSQPFTFEILNKKANKVSKEKEKTLQHIFDENMEKICSRFQENSNPYNAVSALFFWENENLFSHTQLSIEEMIKNSKSVSCIEFGYESLLWVNNLPEPSLVKWAMEIDRDDTKYERLFSRMQIPTSELILDLIINKFLYDDFANINVKENNLNEVLTKTFLGREYLRENDIESFLEIAEYRKEQIEKEFNPFTEKKDFIKMRNAILNLYMAVVKFVGTLISKNLVPSSFTNQQGIRLNQLLIKIVAITDFFSVRFRYYKEFSGLLSNVENMAEGFVMIKSSIEVQMNNTRE